MDLFLKDFGRILNDSVIDFMMMLSLKSSFKCSSNIVALSAEKNKKNHFNIQSIFLINRVIQNSIYL